MVVGALGDSSFAGNLFYYSANGSTAISSGVTGNVDGTQVTTYQYEGNVIIPYCGHFFSLAYHFSSCTGLHCEHMLSLHILGYQLSCIGHETHTVRHCLMPSCLSQHTPKCLLSEGTTFEIGP